MSKRIKLKRLYMLPVISIEPSNHQRRLRQNTRTPREHEAFIQKYAVGKLIAEGSFGHVHLAKREGKIYVAKIKIPPEAPADNEFINEIFQREIEVSDLLKEGAISGVTLLHAFSISAEKIVLIYNYEGEDFFNHFILPKNHRPLMEVWHAVRGLECGLEELASHGLFHRDIRPENVCISAHGEVKIIDPATIIHAPAPAFTFLGANRNNMPVEMLLQCPDSGLPADQWACGILISALLVRSALFKIEWDLHALSEMTDSLEFDPVTQAHLEIQIALYRIEKTTGETIPRRIVEAADPTLREVCFTRNQEGEYSLQTEMPYPLDELPLTPPCEEALFHWRTVPPQDQPLYDKLSELALGLLRVDPRERLTAVQCIATMDAFRNPNQDEEKT